MAEGLLWYRCCCGICSCNESEELGSVECGNGRVVGGSDSIEEVIDSEESREHDGESLQRL